MNDPNKPNWTGTTDTDTLRLVTQVKNIDEETAEKFGAMTSETLALASYSPRQQDGHKMSLGILTFIGTCTDRRMNLKRYGKMIAAEDALGSNIDKAGKDGNVMKWFKTQITEHMQTSKHDETLLAKGHGLVRK